MDKGDEDEEKVRDIQRRKERYSYVCEIVLYEIQ